MERNIPDMQTLFVPAEILGKPRISAGIRFVMMMRRDVVLRGLVALRADRVPGRAQLLRMRVVAITARDAGGVHAALQPRAPDVDLVPLLAVCVVQRGRQQ